jgi:hypothetical protein
VSDLETLMDRWAIEATISRLGRCLDERDFEGLRDLFTIDATVQTTPPSGRTFVVTFAKLGVAVGGTFLGSGEGDCGQHRVQCCRKVVDLVRGQGGQRARQ